MSITLHAELEEIKRLGEISDSKDAACDPFSGSPDPYYLDPSDFSTGVEVADALLESTPQDGSVLMDFGKAEEDNSFFQEEEHGDEPCDDPFCNCHSDCEVNECETCFEKWIDAGEREADAARDREMGL